MLTQRPAGGVFDIRQDVFVICPGNDLAKSDARRETENFVAADHLPRELIEEGKPLAVRARFSEPGDGMFHRPREDNPTHNRDHNLQAGHALQKYLQTARPVMEFSVGLRHECRICFDAAAREDEQGTAAFQVTDRVADDLHSAHRVTPIGREDGAFVDVRHVLKERDVPDNGFVIRTVDVRRDEDRIHRGRMIGCDDEWSAGGDVLDTARFVRFYEARQEPARAAGESAHGNGMIKIHSHFGRGAGGFAENEPDQVLRARGLGEREGFGQLEDQRFGERMDLDGVDGHGFRGEGENAEAGERGLGRGRPGLGGVRGFIRVGWMSGQNK